MTLKCPECNVALGSKKQAREHYQEYHSGEVETPEKYLNQVDSEQRDFHGDEPTNEGHNPEYLNENEPPKTRETTLFSHEREGDESLAEFEDPGDSE